MKQRGFEIVSAYQGLHIHLPVRKTAMSAGYDLAAAEDAVLEPHTVTLIKTGLKAYMQENEYLGIHIRSGFSVRHTVLLPNGQGIIDADYYNNPENEGHILIAIYNYGEKAINIEKGMRVAQGIFYTYLLADTDCAAGCRKGGLGSTGER